MRKQYHLRDSEFGLLAWDVHGLIKATRSLQASSVPLADIRELDQPYWYQTGDVLPTCRDLIAHMQLLLAADLGYPIILAADGSVMDGMHRVAKALLRGDTHALAVRFPVTPEPDFVGIAADALPYDDDSAR